MSSDIIFGQLTEDSIIHTAGSRWFVDCTQRYKHSDSGWCTNMIKSLHGNAMGSQQTYSGHRTAALTRLANMILSC